MSNLIKILVVDDEVVIHKLFEKILGGEGYQLLFATSGAEGLEQFRAEQPDVLVLDFRMLGVTGDEFMDELSDSDLARVPIIMISGHATPEIDLSERNQRKLFAFFEKPFFEVNQLKQSIDLAAQRKRH